MVYIDDCSEFTNLVQLGLLNCENKLRQICSFHAGSEQEALLPRRAQRVRRA